jgi:DNA-binding HxlR family transcriptional regulator
MPKRYTPVTAAADLEKALRFLEGRWKLVILFHLFGGKIMRFSELERAIPAITQKMLGQQLKALEADGIVLRTFYPQVPPKVEYSLTSWGQSLCPALDAILKWADRRPAHVRKVSETRRPKNGSSARPRTAPEWRANRKLRFHVSRHIPATFYRVGICEVRFHKMPNSPRTPFLDRIVLTFVGPSLFLEGWPLGRVP